MTVDSQCINCKHFINDGKWGCDAFFSIPDEIVFNRVIHDKPIKGQDNNIVFEKEDGEIPPFDEYVPVKGMIE